MNTLKTILIISFIGLLVLGALSFLVDPIFRHKSYYLRLKDWLRVVIMIFTAGICLSFGAMVVIWIVDLVKILLK